MTGTRSLAVRGWLRRGLTRVHRWTGLVIMACLFVAAATGTWLTFRIEMDRLVNPELRVVRPESQRVPLVSVVDDIARRFPNASVSHADPARAQTPTIRLARISTRAIGTPLPIDRVFFNPYTGGLLGGSNTHQIVFARANVDTLVDRPSTTACG